jgi:predicted lipid-binding transport protein (Tim44 family)
VILLARRAQRAKALDFLPSRAALAVKADKTEALLAFLAQQDPDLEPDRLRQLARTTFLQLQECWQARDDYTPMEPLLTPALYAEHRALLDSMRRNHEINRLENLQVEQVDLVHVRFSRSAEQDEFTVLITARAADYYVDDRTGRRLRGNALPNRFQEFWTFRRQDGHWLLRSIEQSRESKVLEQENHVEYFSPSQLQEIYGNFDGAEVAAEDLPESRSAQIERELERRAQRDSLWEPARLEERVRQVFLDVMMAQEAGTLSAVKVEELYPNVAEKLREEIRQRQEKGVTQEFRNLCVRKVEVVALGDANGDGGDQFTAHISAHAQKVMRQHGRVIGQDAEVTPFELYWTFSRDGTQWKLREVLSGVRYQQLLQQNA